VPPHPKCSGRECDGLVQGGLELVRLQPGDVVRAKGFDEREEVGAELGSGGDRLLRGDLRLQFGELGAEGFVGESAGDWLGYRWGRGGFRFSLRGRSWFGFDCGSRLRLRGGRVLLRRVVGGDLCLGAPGASRGLRSGGLVRDTLGCLGHPDRQDRVDGSIPAGQPLDAFVRAFAQVAVDAVAGVFKRRDELADFRAALAFQREFEDVVLKLFEFFFHGWWYG